MLNTTKIPTEKLEWLRSLIPHALEAQKSWPGLAHAQSVSIGVQRASANFCGAAGRNA